MLLKASNYAYRTIEQAIFLTISDSDIQEKEEQNQRIRTLFHRQLAIPHVDLKSTLQAYKAWEVKQGKVLDVESSEPDGISSRVASAYQRALEGYNAHAHHEEQISRQDISYSEKLQQFVIYLKFEESSGYPAQLSKVVREVYSRATKNCPWVWELWVRYLLCLERSRASEEELAAVFEKSSQCTFSTIDEFLDLFLTRVDGLRRRFSFTGEVWDYSIIRETFKNASDYFSRYLKNTEGLVRFHSYWARLELNLGKDLNEACAVRESLLKICGSNWEAWKGYIAMEIKLGHINEARSIYKRCYTRRFYGTGSEEICHSWVRFEREYGTLEDFDHAVKKVTRHLEALQPRTSLEV